MRRTDREAFAAFRSSSPSQKQTQPGSERKTTAKITRQPFLVHLQHHAAPLSPSAPLLFDFCVCGWSFLLPQSPPLMSFLFLSFSPPRAVFDCRVQPIKNRNHRVWQGRPQQYPQRFLILASFVARSAAAAASLLSSVGAPHVHSAVMHQIQQIITVVTRSKSSYSCCFLIIVHRKTKRGIWVIMFSPLHV